MEDLFITNDFKTWRLETLQGEVLATYRQQGQHQVITIHNDDAMVMQRKTGGTFSGNFTYFQGSKVLFYSVKQGNGKWHIRTEQEHLYSLVQISQTSYCLYDSKGRALVDIDWTVLMIKRIRARVRFHASEVNPQHVKVLLSLMFPHITSLTILAIAPLMLLSLYFLKVWLLDVLLPGLFNLIDAILS